MVHNAAETLNASSQSLDSEPGETQTGEKFFHVLVLESHVKHN